MPRGQCLRFLISLAMWAGKHEKIFSCHFNDCNSVKHFTWSPNRVWWMWTDRKLFIVKWRRKPWPPLFNIDGWLMRSKVCPFHFKRRLRFRHSTTCVWPTFALYTKTILFKSLNRAPWNAQKIQNPVTDEIGNRIIRFLLSRKKRLRAHAQRHS